MVVHQEKMLAAKTDNLSLVSLRYALISMHMPWGLFITCNGEAIEEMFSVDLAFTFPTHVYIHMHLYTPSPTKGKEAVAS